jgi:microcystin-dependent protein
MSRNQNRSYPQSGKISKSYGSVNVYDNIRNKWISLQTNRVGDLKFSAHSIDHYGWLICDGRSVSRTEYSELFDIIGISFGSNDGSTFKLPDLRGRVAGGIGDGPDTSNRILGTAVGSETHTLTVPEMPSHNHTITDPGHTHSYVNNTNDQNTDNAFNSETAADQADLAATTGSSTTGITVNSTGGGNPHNNMQPTLFIGNMFIYAPNTYSPF